MAINRIKVEENAQRYIRRGNWERALKEYLLLVEDDPKDARSLLKCADIYVKLERKREALDAYRAVAQHYAQQDMYEKALAVYRQALRLDESQADLHEAIGKAYHLLGRLKDAIRAYYQAQKMYKERGDMARQRAVLEAMLEIDPDDVGLRIQLAERYAKDNLIDKALELFRTSADLLEEEGRLDELVQVLERILFLAPEDFASRKRVIHVYLGRQEQARALRHLQVCFKELPGDIETLELLGQTFERLERASKAVLVYEELIGLYREQNQEARVQDMYRRILRLDPENRVAQRALGAPSRKPSSVPSLDHSDKLSSSPSTSNMRAATAHLRETKDALAGVEFLDGEEDLFLVSESSEPAKETPPVARAPERVASQPVARTSPPAVAPVAKAPVAAPPVIETFDVLDDIAFLSEASESVVDFHEFELPDDVLQAEAVETVEWNDALSEAEVRQLLTECQVFLKYGLYDKAHVVISGVLERAPDSIIANEQMLALHEAMKDSELVETQLLTLARITRSNLERSRAYLTRALAVARDPKRIYDEARRLQIALDDEPNTEDLGELSADDLDADVFAADDGGEIAFLDPESEFDASDIEVLVLPEDSSAILSEAELMFDNHTDFVELDVDEFPDLDDAELSALENVASEAGVDGEAAVIDMVFGSLDADDIFDDLFSDFLGPEQEAPVGADDPEGELAEVDFFMQQGLTDQADEALQSFVALHPDHQGAELRRAQMATMRSGADFGFRDSVLGKHSLSQKFVNPFHASEPTNVTQAPLKLLGDTNNSNLELGVSYRDIGLVAEALEEFKQAMDDPDAAPVARYHIALCEADLGQREAARATLNSLLADPGVTLSTELRHAAQVRLAELEGEHP